MACAALVRAARAVAVAPVCCARCSAHSHAAALAGSAFSSCVRISSRGQDFALPPQSSAAVTHHTSASASVAFCARASKAGVCSTLGRVGSPASACAISAAASRECASPRRASKLISSWWNCASTCAGGISGLGGGLPASGANG
ncbi:MAG: hypothetical protein DYH18_04500 [Xanthomonadales bacterium PRO7]|nr:hypothetical protein [Xanthomonadales bacterium PRO7]